MSEEEGRPAGRSSGRPASTSSMALLDRAAETGAPPAASRCCWSTGEGCGHTGVGGKGEQADKN